jgi:predicted nuclease with TOPRIM domain
VVLTAVISDRAGAEVASEFFEWLSGFVGQDLSLPGAVSFGEGNEG